MENSQKQPNKSSPVKKQLIIIFFLTTALFAGIAIKAGRDYHWWLPETEIVSVLTPEDLKTKIDVNESPWYELLLLPKVGEAKAKAIVAYREKYGRFVMNEIPTNENSRKGTGISVFRLNDRKVCVYV